ncbi:MAG: hypothetical protein P1V51_04605 [Deltaproteobacteria bacterium]|nr:hypothetical protein [Deltaproteobacteria bacterium]
MPHSNRRRQGAQGRNYKVVFHYREPTWEARHGRREHPFRISFEVVAIDHDHAQEKARGELLKMRANSGVSWIIQIERTMITELEARASA